MMQTSSGLQVIVWMVVMAIAAVITLVVGSLGVGFGVAAAMIGLLVASLAASAVRLASQWERAIVLRLGQFHGERGPGLFFVIPVIETVPYVLDMRTITTVFKAEQTMTRDTVP